MPTYGAFEAKNKFSELLDRAERGEEVVITRHGKAVAKLVAKNERPDDERGQDLIRRMRETRAQLRKEGVSFSVEEIFQLRDEGRR